MMVNSSTKLIAFYLPQFHPIPENDEWWGKGFTEWTNVVKARPLFDGHYQPHLPADLGFYDLRVPETRETQADLARRYGIHGFCYYHYWFHGKTLLQRPLDEMMASGKPDFPFCICWANESWTRRWEHDDTAVLIEQRYSSEDDLAHIRFLMPILADRRYIRVGDRPLLLVYRPNLMPDPKRTAEIWRTEMVRAGLPEPFLCLVRSLPQLHFDPALIDFDAAVEFYPDWGNLPTRIYPVTEYLGERIAQSRLRNMRGTWRVQQSILQIEKHLRSLNQNDPFLNHNIIRYQDMVDRSLIGAIPDYRVFPSVTLNWDNSPRRQQGAVILVESTPDKYGQWLRHAIARAQTHLQPSEQFVFINAWNEWAEGTHLEPDQKWGHAYLGVTRDTLLASQNVARGYQEHA